MTEKDVEEDGLDESNLALFQLASVGRKKKKGGSPELVLLNLL